MSSKDKTLISDLMGSFVSEVPTHPFVSFCVVCNKGVTHEEMVYQKGKVFHKDCYDKHGSSFPQVNHQLLSENSNDIVQLVQLRNLKIRMMGTTNHNSVKSKTKKKSKRKTKKRSTKGRVTKRKRTATKRKKTTKKTSRRKISKKRRVVKRKTSSKSKKTARKTKRRASRQIKRKTRRRR
jgi:hypothetical protein